MNSIREVILEHVRKNVPEHTPDLHDSMPIDDIFTQLGDDGQDRLFDTLEKELNFTNEDSLRRHIHTVEDLVSYVYRRRFEAKYRGTNVDPIQKSKSGDRANRATSLLTHYSTVRASITLALLTVSFGLITYVFRYVSDNANNVSGPVRYTTWVTLASECIFYVAALAGALRLSNSIEIMKEYLIKIEEDDFSRPTGPMKYLSERTSRVRSRFRPRDMWDWVLIVGLLLQPLVASTVYKLIHESAHRADSTQNISSVHRPQNQIILQTHGDSRTVTDRGAH